MTSYQTAKALYMLSLYNDDGSHFKCNKITHKMTCFCPGWLLNKGTNTCIKSRFNCTSLWTAIKDYDQLMPSVQRKSCQIASGTSRCFCFTWLMYK